MVDYIRLQYPEVVIACHPECKKEVVAKCDYVGSTSQMINFVKNHSKDQFFLITECGLSTRLKLELPQKSFVGTCTLCKYMKSNTLENILRVLKNPQKDDIIQVPEEVRKKALVCINKMFEYAQ
jgi:quinolinate synthase